MNNKTAIFSLHDVNEQMSLNEKYMSVGENTGNIIFDTALSELIDADKVYWNSSQDIIDQYDQFITTSYIWIRQNQEISSPLKLVKDRPLIPMSIGLQANVYDPNFVIHPNVIRDLKEIEERCVLGCRGEYTAEILNKYGIKNTMVIGCPSLYMGLFSPNSIIKKSNKPNNIVTNFSTFWRKLKYFEVDFLKYIAENNYSFIEQTANEFKKSYLADNDQKLYDLISDWLKKEKIFFTFKSWTDDIKQYDFSIGYRFHGNVIAVNNGIPALFIYSDSRVQELCDFFRLPMIADKDFDYNRPIEYWYEKADYSEFNKLKEEKKNLFREFCKKNNLHLKFDKNLNETEKKISINSSKNPLYNYHWNHFEFNGIDIFQSDETMCNHLWFKLPIKTKKDYTYNIKFRMKFMTDCKNIRLYLENESKKTQQIYTIENEYKNDYYDVNITFASNDEYEYLSVTNSDFIGKNFIAVSNIEIHECVVSNIKQVASDDSKQIGFLIGQYAESSLGFGSLMDYFNDKKVESVSIFYTEDLWMKTLHGIMWEAGINIYMDIAEKDYKCTLVGNTYSCSLLDDLLKNQKYNKSIPIMVVGYINDELKKKIKKLSDAVYSFYDIYKYAVAKNCIVSPIKKYLDEKKIFANIVYMNLPTVFDVDQPSDYEMQIRTGKYVKCYDKLYDFDNKYSQKLKYTEGPYWRGTGKKLEYINITNDYCISINGIRRTFHQMPKFKKNIWFIGTSVSSGAGSVIDEHTIESFLQEILNLKKPNIYRVNNIVLPSGYHFGNIGSLIKKLPIKNDDIILLSNDYGQIFNNKIFLTEPVDKMMTFIDNRPFFQRPHNLGEIFIDMVHMNPRGYKKYAESIYLQLSEKKIFENCSRDRIASNNRKIESDLEPELEKYVRSLQKYYKNGYNGCIVMNCNPFTLGHRYLIEYAAKKVDNLYIFVVEEDKSIFKFKDRFDLVQKGTEDINNVIVIPSGQYIISAITFKAYFEKGEKQDLVVDTSEDLNIFGKYIAPALNIKVRFAGQEPFDNITKQYNNAMEVILPQYNIQFVEIPRVESDQEVISASRVRKFLEQDNFEEIKKIVPESTFSFLKKYKRIDKN